MYYWPTRYLTSLTIGTTDIFHVFIPFESLLVNRAPCASHPNQTMALLTALWPREVKKKKKKRKRAGPFSNCGTKAEVPHWSARPRSLLAQLQGKHEKSLVLP